jgi:hypothetical protein
MEFNVMLRGLGRLARIGGGVVMDDVEAFVRS